MTTLTNTAIAAMQPGDELKDNLVAGLYVRANATGKSFLLYYRCNGVQRRPKVGTYGHITIAQAREIARNMLAQVAAGNDPSLTRQQARHAPTMDELWTRVERQHYCNGKAWDRDAKRLWLKNAQAKLGKRRVQSIEVNDIDDLHAAMRSTPIEANRTLSILSCMLNLAEKWNMRPVGSNPCQRVTRYRERSRRRFASLDEIAAVSRELEREAATNPSAVAFIHLLIYTGARPSEIERATWDELEPGPDGGGVLRIEKGKTGERTVLLPRQAMEIINRLPRNKPTILGRKLPRNFWLKIRERSGAKGLWARDWRRTFATTGLSSGMSLSMLGELLGHKSAQTTKVYAKLMEESGMKATASIANIMEERMRGGGQ